MPMLRSMMNGAGYFRQNNRASGGRLVEADVVGCAHCQRAMLKADWAEDGGFCHCCDAPVCGPCADAMLTAGCVSFKAKLDAELERSYRARQNAMLMGAEPGR